LSDKQRKKKQKRKKEQGSANLASNSWLEMIAMAIRTPVFDHERAIYTNRTLRFGQVSAVGFDFDHTLAIYNCPALDDLAGSVGKSANSPWHLSLLVTAWKGQQADAVAPPPFRCLHLLPSVKPYTPRRYCD